MQLRNTRLCLDCEELHEQQQCPICASESFTYLTRWIPADERRQRPRLAPSREPQPKEDNRLKWLKRGAASVAVVALSRWLWQASRSSESTQPKTGDLGSETRDQ